MTPTPTLPPKPAPTAEPTGLALLLLRAEMMALAAMIPGLTPVPAGRPASRIEDEAETEALFDNMPV